MLDTASIKFYTEQEFKKIGIIFKNLFNLECSADTKKLTVRLQKETGDWRWINRIYATPKKGKVEIIIDFSYPKFFSKDNVQLVNSERDFQRVNNALFKKAKYITQDNSLEKDYFEYIRIDIAEQYLVNFEKHYNVFKFLYLLLENNVGVGTKESKAFLRMTYGQNGDYTTGFRYKANGYCITPYNKTLQMNIRDYKPFGESLMRVEQSFTQSALNKGKGGSIYLKDASVELFREKYKIMIEEYLLKHLEGELNKVYSELKVIVEDIVRRGRIKQELRLHDGKILDQKLVLNIIHNMELEKTSRMKYHYKNAVKETLELKSEIHRDFKGALKNLEIFIRKVCNKDLTIKFNKNGVNITLKNIDQA